MSQRIHYQDDIYFADRLATDLFDASRLELDPEYFAESVKSTARGAFAAFDLLASLVLENPRLVDRIEHLKMLANISGSLADALPELMDEGREMGKALTANAEEFGRMLQLVKIRREALRDELRALLEDNDLGNDVVSGDELSELLRE